MLISISLRWMFINYQHYLTTLRWLCVSQAIIKPQYVDHIPKAVKGNVGEVLAQKDEREMRFELAKDLDLNQVLDRDVGDLSGGELQRFAIAVVATQHAEIYMFDEPSSYLDVKQRLKAAQVVRSLLRPNRYLFTNPNKYTSVSKISLSMREY